ncbi:hypothetical protein [Metabacillus fastidiosus]|uniref:Uncharacterized protein n=1 Tax=Metabacillus fastidiosus TaxID=1458 RepID=A0ABU6NUC0_9BACI|nr:hypothetical protein [Metabacillus fastidiosus]MED4399962.1 hypothetical protein [Metabacillus fastidiosus]MED4452174.1 hypothetical protein [Metabacillus fastidiosus]MED4462447.1 hypothetical protein [Metabacillus fastidiosus]
MSYFYELPYVMADSMWINLELLLVTACISTIIFVLTKNEYVSLLSSAPVFYVTSLLQNTTTHLFFLLAAMVVQTAIIMTMQYQNQKKLIRIEEKQENTI